MYKEVVIFVSGLMLVGCASTKTASLDVAKVDQAAPRSIAVSSREMPNFPATALGNANQDFGSPLGRYFENRLVEAEALLETAEGEQRAKVLHEIATLKNSLLQPDEALYFIDMALELYETSAAASIDKAKILISMHRFHEAEEILDDVMSHAHELTRERDESVPPLLWYVLSREAFIADVYRGAMVGEYNNGINSLRFFIDLDDDEYGFYKCLWYLALVEMGGDRDPWFENYVMTTAENYGKRKPILDVMLGEKTPGQALSDIESMGLDDFSRINLMAEFMFFAGILEGDAASKSKRLDQLNSLSPYGSAEWMVARKIFNADT